jgi:phage-related protein (TIGR01555 family)
MPPTPPSSLQLVHAHQGRTHARVDAWKHALTGLGGSRDKSTHAEFCATHILTGPELDALYLGSDLAARIVDAVPQEAFREGFGIEGDEDGAVKEVADRFNLIEVGTEADTWGRLFGGGFVLIGTGELDPPIPLDDEAVAPGEVLYLDVLDCQEVQLQRTVTDPRRADFGQPEFYLVTRNASDGASAFGSFMVHASRLVHFPGVKATRTVKARTQGCDLSVLQRVWEVLRAAGQNWQSASLAMQDLSQAVFKVKNLVSMIANGERENLLERMAITDMSRSVARAVVVDADLEDFKQVGAANLGALPGLLDRTWQRVASAARMPVVVLMGISPSGLGATGNSDIRAWYDQIATHQEQILRPRMTRLVRLLARSWAPGVNADELEVVFPALWQPTEQEEAQRRLTVAQADAVYMANGVVTPDEVAISRWGAGDYSPEMSAVALDLREPGLAIAAPEEGQPLIPPPEGGDPDEPVAGDPVPVADALSALRARSGRRLR